MKAGRLALFSVVFCGLLISKPGSARAHSFPRQETPSAGETLTTAPAEIVIKFDAPIEKVFAKLEVLDSSGKNLAQDQPLYGSDGATLSTKVAPLPAGTYTVKWAVVGADTHRTEGSYAFTVGKSRS
jgi:methionine-rich copper-binding protein CopC